MIKLGPNKYMIEDISELPVPDAENVFCDVETTSFNKKRAGDNPWMGDRVCGYAVTWDEHPIVYYLPVRHESDSLIGSGVNLPIKDVVSWFNLLFKKAKRWINHNIKFDASFSCADGIEFDDVRMICTLTWSKMMDTDLGRYGLKFLFKTWLNRDTETEDKVKEYLKAYKTKNYGDVPADILGSYACDDVAGNRELYHYIKENQYESGVWETEVDLTKVLWRVEEYGFVINPQEVKIEMARTIRKIIELASRIAELTGREYSGSSQWVYDLLVNVHGLPILMYNDKTGRPTFNKRALQKYENFVQGDLKEVVRCIRQLRQEEQYKSLFLDAFTELRDDQCRIHPRYNQIVRTGRMSCKGPNIQQQNKRSKALLHPRKGRAFISADYSQIEFRLIAHYARDQAVIDAYNNDPDTDFHVLVTKMMFNVEKPTKAQRKKGKTMNFEIGYGAGKRKVIKDVSSDEEIIEEANAKLKEMDQVGNQELFESLCEARASELYSAYHEKMPGIQRVTKEAQSVCRRRGFVFNAHNRRRHLPNKMARKAFNSVTQGGAMDIIKEAMVKCANDPVLREFDCRIVANVHDEILFECPEEFMMNRTLHDRIVFLLENPSVTFRVPIRTGLGVSRNSWAEAAGDDTYVSGKKVSIVEEQVGAFIIEQDGKQATVDRFALAGKLR